MLFANVIILSSIVWTIWISNFLSKVICLKKVIVIHYNNKFYFAYDFQKTIGQKSFFT